MPTNTSSSKMYTLSYLHRYRVKESEKPQCSPNAQPVALCNTACTILMELKSSTSHEVTPGRLRYRLEGGALRASMEPRLNFHHSSATLIIRTELTAPRLPSPPFLSTTSLQREALLLSVVTPRSTKIAQPAVSSSAPHSLRSRKMYRVSSSSALTR